MKAKLYQNSLLLIILLAHLVICTVTHAQIQVKDDSSQIIILQQPAKNVISLSPGLTELIYSAGGAQYLKGVVSYSDFPEQAKEIPQVGSYNALDLEKIIALQPDLVVAWKSGNPTHQVEQLIKLGLTVYISEPNNFMDIPRTINTLGKLMGTETISEQNSIHFINEFKRLETIYQNKIKSKNKRTFIQIWNKPVMSVNKDHLISKVITFCGGENIFAQAKGLTSAPSIESILVNNPDLIIATGMADTSKKWLSRWQQWPSLNAVKNKHLYAVNPDHLVRHTPRILLGIDEVCRLLNQPSPVIN